MLRILSIDPGYDRLGIAVLEKNEQGKEILLFSECFQTKRSDEFYQRILKIGKEVTSVIDEYQPSAMAIETLFFNTNQKTAMKVAECRGVVIYQALQKGLKIFEYSPLQIKSAITGDGRADKKQMISLLPKLIVIKNTIEHDDEYDAIATGLTCFVYEKKW